MGSPSLFTALYHAFVNFPRIISDATIGLSDGLTVPFALTAGLSALGDTKVVIYGGMAELFAGAISMGVGGYLGARSECQAHDAALSDTQRTVRDKPSDANWQIRSALAQYGLSEATMTNVVAELSEAPEAMQKFIMRFHHEQTDSAGSSIRAYVSGLTIALGYFLGGLLPLLPYLFIESVQMAFWFSCGVMINVLFIFGCVKTWMIDDELAMKCIWHGLQMVVLGGLAACAAMACVSVIGKT
ncbi:DUF125-domain-containing protein [Myriangium duriaei CBS 260.36]|uniref:DUF125-domain-containing protein n=1 Tax=Myriangium duriaei CBS 260.36 TaxID=1168546 RepID=A0A9P4J3X6_9PEZI|nr:DUF125-domain-containing protein [Myriangium duriaei CBS 260.36]